MSFFSLKKLIQLQEKTDITKGIMGQQVNAAKQILYDFIEDNRGYWPELKQRGKGMYVVWPVHSLFSV